MKKAVASKRASRRSMADRGRRIVGGLRKAYPDADCELHHGNDLELLVATILSAQCTDERVNRVTPALFAKYRTAADYAAAAPATLEQEIKPTGFFRNKARSLIGLGKAVVERFRGKLPDRMEDLVTLPGVGRKTANVLLGTWHHVPSIVVDTHVKRLAARLGLTREEDADRIEQDLQKVFPEDDWTFATHALIWHGRRICHARKPRCVDCVLADLCPSAKLFLKQKPVGRGLVPRRQAKQPLARGAARPRP